MQLFEPVSCTYTYLLACNRTQRALIIDPVRETAERDAKLIKELGLQLEFGLNTHLHADHVTGTAKLKDVHLFPKMRSVLSKIAGGRADLLVDEGATVSVGETVELEVRATPGHTNGKKSCILLSVDQWILKKLMVLISGCVSYVCHGLRAVFTGDALLIRGCGRTDFQQGMTFQCCIVFLS